MTERYEDLYDLTGKESGLVMWDNGEALITNWVGVKGLPRLFGPAGYPVGLAETLVAESVEVPEDAVRLMQEHEVEQGESPDNVLTDGYVARRVTTDSGETVTVVTHPSWA